MSDNSAQRPPGPSIDFSVVIPVFNDDAKLPECLHCLANQTLPRARFEVLVIDNGSRIDIGQRFSAQFPWVRFFREERAGSYHARNTGVANARGEFVGFTDADCRPDRDWLEQGLRYFRDDPQLAYIAGRIDLDGGRRGIRWPGGTFETLAGFRQQEYLETGHFGATANVMVRRRLVENQVGWFDEASGRGDDAAWGLAIYQAKLAQRYAPDIVIRHPVRSFWELIAKHRRDYGRHFSWELEQRKDSKGALLYQVLKTDWHPSMRRLRWYLGTHPRTVTNVLAVAAVGLVVHYAVLVEKVLLVLGKRPLPR